MPRQAPLADLNEPLIPPVLELELPGQREEPGRLNGGRTENKSHRHLVRLVVRDSCLRRRKR